MHHFEHAVHLNVEKLGIFDGLRVATEDYLKSRRIYKATANANTHEDDLVEVDALSRKGMNGKGKIGKGKEGGKKGKASQAGQGLR